MKEIVSNVAIFVVLTLVFSSLNGCSGTQTAVNSSNMPNPPNVPSKPAPKSDSGSSSVYPSLPSGLASAELEMLDGTKVKISDKQGKALILNLWAIWCGFCREEMPHLQEMQKKYADRLEVISVSVGNHDNGAPEPIPDIKKYAADNKIDYTLGRIGGESLKQYYMLTKQTPIPQTILIDRDGHLRGTWVGGGPQNVNSIQQALDKLMAES